MVFKHAERSYKMSQSTSGYDQYGEEFIGWINQLA
jgi:hypothetical protein